MPNLFHTRRPKLLCAILACALSFTTQAQQQPDILTYIHNSWQSLSRSTSTCASVEDIKISADTKTSNTPSTPPPIIYIPSDSPIPQSLTDLQQHCTIQITHLPQPIHHIGDLNPKTLPHSGLLYLPNPYVVPGG